MTIILFLLIRTKYWLKAIRLIKSYCARTVVCIYSDKSASSFVVWINEPIFYEFKHIATYMHVAILIRYS